jgi:3-oxoacyl-[acyl-carrier protein] reductase
MKYQEIQIGMVRKLTHKLTSNDINRFVELTGDDNRIHTDFDYASRTSYKEPVAHGMLSASFISTIIGTKLPGDGALWFSQSLEFLLPVRVGDFLTVSAKVVKKDDKSNVIELQTNVSNQYKQLVIKGFAKVKVVEQEPEMELPDNQSNSGCKVALVIGGSGGIGYAACKTLAKNGFDIGIHYMSNESAARRAMDEVIKIGRRAYLFRSDVTDKTSVQEMVLDVICRMGTITAMVNCTSSRIPAIKLSNLEWNDFQIHINNQIKGTLNLVQAVIPEMEKNGYGKIICINSQALDVPSADWLPYITAKGALMGFCRALALDLAPKGIRINSVSPGMTQTDLIGDIPERIKMVVAAKTPLRRLAFPNEIANAISFLASENSDYLCGETIRVNGGQVMI